MPKPTSLIPSHFSRAQTNFLHSKPLQSGQNRLLSFQAGRLHSEPFQSSQNRLPPFQAIALRPRPTFSNPSYSSWIKTDFLHSKPFQSCQDRPPPFQAISLLSLPCRIWFYLIRQSAEGWGPPTI
jgi:hypothetical protein